MDRLSGAELAAVLESAPDAIIIVGGDGGMLFANGQAEQMFGYPRAELAGKPVEMLLPQRFRGRHASHRDAYIADPRTRPMGTGLDLYGARKDGSEFPVEISLSPISTGSGRLVSAIIRDVTDRKRADEELGRLRHQQSLLLNSVTEGILSVDAAGMITYVNPAGARLLGYEPSALVGQSEHEMLHARRADGRAYPVQLCPIHRSVGDGSTHHATGEVLWTRSGSPLAVDYTSAPIREHGRIVGASVMFFPAADGESDDEIGGRAGISRPLARRIVHDIVEQGGVNQSILTHIGRRLAAETAARGLSDHLDAYGEMGLGELHIEKEEGTRYSFTGQDLLERRPESRLATCAFTLGYLSEAVSHVHKGEPTLGTEIDCQSRGGARCRFVVQVKKAEDGLSRRVKELI